MKKLCVGCNRYLPVGQFKEAGPDFPTRDGRVYKCSECVNPNYRLRRTPDGKVEAVKNEN